MTDDRMSSEGNEFARQAAGNGSSADNSANPGAFRGGLSRAGRHDGAPVAGAGRLSEAGSHAGSAARNATAAGAHGANGRNRESVPAPSNDTAVRKQDSRNRAVPDEDEEYEEERFPLWARVVFWLFRKSIVPVIMIVMLLAGLYVGYVYLGKAPEDDVFEWATWRHLYDLIFAES